MKAPAKTPEEETRFGYVRVRLDITLRLKEPVQGIPAYFHDTGLVAGNVGFILKDTGAPVEGIEPGARLQVDLQRRPRRSGR